MDPQDIRAGVLTTLRGIAPEVEVGELEGGRPLREQVDLDSMDWLNVLIGVHKRFGVEIPETDYARLVTLNDIVAYVAARLH